MAANVINYAPPPTIEAFIQDYRPGKMFFNWIVGPVGSGKTTGIFFKLVYMASLQAKGPDGIRRTRAVIVRNTYPMLKDTTLSSWGYWFKHGQAGEWVASQNKFILCFGDCECEVLFRPLDTPDDVSRVLSLEVTFALIDEFVEIRKEIIEALSARCGRYPSAKDGGATNWGMWGSSNPSTEDNWWFDYLHNNPQCLRISNHHPDAVRVETLMRGGDDKPIRYFVQPSGLSDEAENIDNLPGGRDYYTSQVEVKGDVWVKQFIEAEWGFSIAGKPVVPNFRADLHVAKSGLVYNPHLPLVIGLDPGLACSALIFGQQSLDGRLIVLGELIQSGYGAERLVQERLKPYLASRFNLRGQVARDNVVLAPDPAAGQRSQRDEKTVVDELKKHYPTTIESNNRLPLRLDAISHFTDRLVGGMPALQIDPQHCPQLIRALKGGWRWEVDPKKDQLKGSEPEKNQHSHPGDAFGYLARYFHRQTQREIRYGIGTTGGRASRPFAPPQFTSNYHFR